MTVPPRRAGKTPGAYGIRAREVTKNQGSSAAGIGSAAYFRLQNQEEERPALSFPLALSPYRALSLFLSLFLFLSICLCRWHDGTRFVVTLWRAHYAAAPIVLSLAITGHEVGGT
jgi:hypothetical protein